MKFFFPFNQWLIVNKDWEPLLLNEDGNQNIQHYLKTIKGGTVPDDHFVLVVPRGTRLKLVQIYCINDSYHWIKFYVSKDLREIPFHVPIEEVNFLDLIEELEQEDESENRFKGIEL